MVFDLDGWIAGCAAACAVTLACAAVGWSVRSTRALRLAACAAVGAVSAGAGALVELGRLQVGVPLRQPADVAFAAAAVLLAVAGAVAWSARPAEVRGRCTLLAFAATLGLFGAALFSAWHSQVMERPPAFRTFWLPYHAGAWTAALALALASSGARLVARGRDARLARLAEPFADTAFAAATIGLASGCIWSLQAWGALWAWEPKSILALLAWMALAAAVLPVELPRPVFARGALVSAAAAVMLLNLLGAQYVPSAGQSIHVYMPDRGSLSVEASREAPTPPALAGGFDADDPATFSIRRR